MESIIDEISCEISCLISLSCKVCRKQDVGRTITTFRTRFNNYKSSSRRFDVRELVNQSRLLMHFSEVGHHDFLRTLFFRLSIGCLGTLGLGEVFGTSGWILLPLRDSASDLWFRSSAVHYGLKRCKTCESFFPIEISSTG